MKKYYAHIARAKVAGSEILDKKLQGRTVVPVRVGMNQKIQADVSPMYDYRNMPENGSPILVEFPNVLGDTIRVQFYFDGPGQDNDSLRTSYEYKGRLFEDAAETVQFINEQFGYLAEFKIIGTGLFVVNHMFPGKLTSIDVDIFWD